MRPGMDVDLHVAILNSLDVNSVRYHLGVWLEGREEVCLGDVEGLNFEEYANKEFELLQLI